LQTTFSFDRCQNKNSRGNSGGEPPCAAHQAINVFIVGCNINVRQKALISCWATHQMKLMYAHKEHEINLASETYSARIMSLLRRGSNASDFKKYLLFDFLYIHVALFFTI